MQQSLSYLTREYAITTDEIVAVAGKLVAFVEQGVAYAFSRKDSDRIDALVAQYVADRDAKTAAEAVTETVATEAPEATATASQVDYIMTLLDRRQRDGLADVVGFTTGPATRQGVARMTRRAASAYIDSLKGEY